MMNKYIGVTVVVASMMLVGCSSNDDSGDSIAGTEAFEDSSVDTAATADGATTDGSTTDGATTDGTVDDMAIPAEMMFVEATENYGNSVMGIIAAQPDTTLFESAAIQAADSLDVLLSGINDDLPKNWTVFVPNDTAMSGVFADRAVLLRHIHGGFIDDVALTNLIGQEIGTTDGSRRVITLDEDGVSKQIDGVKIVQSGIVGDNGVVFRMDGVLQ